MALEAARAFGLLMLPRPAVALAGARGECVGDLRDDTDDPGSPLAARLVVFIWITGAVLPGVAWLVPPRDERRSRWHARSR